MGKFRIKRNKTQDKSILKQSTMGVEKRVFLGSKSLLFEFF